MIRSTKQYKLFCAAFLLFFVALLVYAETFAFTGDEGFHLLTARLIQMGERPYLDFVFPQAPLNAYINAGWMRIFGTTWRSVHFLAAFLTAGAVFLIADFVFTRFPVPAWRLPAAIAAICAVGLNAVVVEYGPLAQAYGMCLFATAAAFRLAVAAVRKKNWWWAALAGLFAGVAPASSLLTAAVAPVLMVWILIYNEAGSRWKKLIALVAAAAVPFAPVLWLLAQGPRSIRFNPVWFNLVQYHLLFRRLYWPETTQHDLEIITSWIDSGQALLLILLGCGGLLVLMFRSRGFLGDAFKREGVGNEAITDCDPRLKAEFYLSAWLALGIGIEVSLAHPTLSRYYVLAVPFAAILAMVGLYAVASKLVASRAAPVLLFAALSCLGLGKSLYERNQEIRSWADYESIAQVVDKVTPPQVPVYASEPVYFLTRRRPPPGMEFFYSHKVDLPPAVLESLHIVTEAELKRRLNAGMFATAVSCDDDEIKEIETAKVYANKTDAGDCTVFWGPQVHPAASR